MGSGQLRKNLPVAQHVSAGQFLNLHPSSRSDIVQQADTELLCLAAFHRLVSDALETKVVPSSIARLDKFHQVLCLFFRIVPESTTFGNLEMGFMVPVPIIDWIGAGEKISRGWLMRWLVYDCGTGEFNTLYRLS